MRKSEWIFASASVIGKAHITRNIPCQDYSKVQRFDNFSIAVVSDGAGSSENSHIGSNKVCEYSLNYFENLVLNRGWNEQDNLPPKELWHELAKQTLCLVKDDLDKFSMSNDLEYKSLSCTIILAIILPSGLLITHIGDGRAGYCDSNLNWNPLITPFHGELANETVFITSDIWDESVIDEYIRSESIETDIKAFCLLTDGCENASFECNLFDQDKGIYFDPNRPFPLFFNPNLKILAQLNDQGMTEAEINKLWEKFLEAGNDRLKNEMDDKTMILAISVS
ncbi:MAG: protein phosphatase 2C domain-containing protein [Chitinophagaceae bacterium]|nr:protein phosphatase 2C domain-containing protein [Chitinophagaceae bacterium]